MLEASGVIPSPSEIHGLLTGLLCRNVAAQALERHAAYHTWLALRPSGRLLEMLDRLYAATQDELDEYSDFQFRILMPADDEDTNSRSTALKEFCEGFLGGFGSGEDDPASSLHEDVEEALADFARIGALREIVEDSDENEADLVEIIEYVRVSVLLVFAECAGNRSR